MSGPYGPGEPRGALLLFRATKSQVNTGVHRAEHYIDGGGGGGGTTGTPVIGGSTLDQTSVTARPR